MGRKRKHRALLIDDRNGQESVAGNIKERKGCIVYRHFIYKQPSCIDMEARKKGDVMSDYAFGYDGGLTHATPIGYNNTRYRNKLGE